VYGDDIYRNAPITSDNPQEGYQTRFGLTVEQPLLKGFGFAANLASLRMAARQSEIAFHDYRRELMTVVAEAELAYWDLYYAQEELKLSQESVQLALTLLEDSQASFDAGRGAKLDVLEAEAGLALRRSRERESFQKKVNAMNNLASYFGGVPYEHQVGYLVTDAPESKQVESIYTELKKAAISMNPDYMKAKIQTEQERVRLGYSKNQRLPEVNLKADMGSSGFGRWWNESWGDLKSYDFPSWSVGLVVRVPLWGDVRGRNEHRAARMRLHQAERNESSLFTQVRVGCDTATQRIGSNFTAARSMESVVDFRVSLLDTRLQSRDVGRMDARSVLEAEQELFAARLEQLQSEIDYQRSLLELQLISGSILHLRNLEVDFNELEERTTYWARNLDRKTPAMDYHVADFNRLPVDDAIQFTEDDFRTPWLGVDWDKLPVPSYDTPYNEENYYDTSPEIEEKHIPRRFDGGHFR
jgi:outer membrane protein TolC